MKLTERVLREQRQRENNLADSRLRKLDEDNDDMDYMEPPAWHFINEEGSVFDHKDDRSLNTAPSVFDRTAIFHVKRSEDS